MRALISALLASSTLLASSALAADSKTEAPAAAAGTISCEAPVAWDATEETLKAQLGAENVEYLDLGGPEGTEMFGTRVYGKDPKKTFDIVWSDDAKRANPSVINVNQIWSEDGETAIAPEWKSTEGVYLGMSIEELEKLNGKPFKLYGFGWDYGGSVISWEGGKLEPAADAKCGVSVILADTAMDGTPGNLQGDTEIMSNNKDMAKAKAQVSRYSVYYVREETADPAAETP